MLKQITHFKRRPDLAAHDFQRHWRTTHAEVVTALPGLRRYVQNHVAAADAAVDGIAEVWFDDIEAMRANAGHAALDRIRDDERNFIDTATMGSIIASPETVIDGAATGAKLIVLVKRNGAVGADEFHRAWRDDVGAAMAALAGRPQAPRRYEQDHTRAGAYRNGREPTFDGIASLWFDTQQSANAFFASGDFGRVAEAERGLMDPARIQAVWVEPLVIR